MVVSGRMESHRVIEQSTTIGVINECLDGPGISGSKGHRLLVHKGIVRVSRHQEKSKMLR